MKLRLFKYNTRRCSMHQRIIRHAIERVQKDIEIKLSLRLKAENIFIKIGNPLMFSSFKYHVRYKIGMNELEKIGLIKRIKK